MLCAYYDKSCDSSGLFADKEIASEDNYRDYMNRYDVIYLDMTNILGKAENTREFISFLQNAVTEEILNTYPSVRRGNAFDETLIDTVKVTGNKFIMIIDEWDAPIRELPEMEKDYLRFLRTLFKSSGTTSKIFAAAYMTGILPIKKDGSQSAISDFREYTMIKPRKFGEFVGFTEQEVLHLCEKNRVDFVTMKQWYDGYSFRDTGSVYNPNSVVQAIDNDDFDSYLPKHAGGSSGGGSCRRTETSAAESLLDYISRDFDGLSKTIADLLGGSTVGVNTLGFANDLKTFRNRDDILTLLIHLGYLAYDEEKKEVRIPNEEIRMEFAKSVREVKRDETIRRLQESDRLIEDVLHLRGEAVAAQIEKIHSEESSRYYNNEQSLRSVIKRAFFSAYDDFILFEELPSGDGIADVVYLPKRDSMMPVIVMELKWNKSAEGAIQQIKEKHYPKPFENYGGDIILVGVNYDRDTSAGERKHRCVIEKYVK